MKYCETCHLSMRTTRKTCPLCQSALKGESDSVFPEIKSVYNQFMLFFKLLLFGTIAGTIIAITINLMIPQSGTWSRFVLLGVVCFWVLLLTAVRRRTNIPRGILNQVFWICIFSIVWDALTVWHGWSLDYVIPCACMTAILALGILGKLLHMPPGDYIGCILADAVLGMVPLLFYLLNMLRFVYLSLTCVAVSVIAIITLFIFAGRHIRSELARRFHV